MKKLLALLFIALPLAIGFTSCNDDDDLPDVSMGITVEKARVLNDTIFVVQGDSIEIASIDIRNNESGKGAIVTQAEYLFAGISYLTPVAPFAWRLATSADPNDFYYIPTGNYPLVIRCNIAAEDKSLAFGIMEFNVHIVASADDIPADAKGGTVPMTNAYVAKQ